MKTLVKQIDGFDIYFEALEENDYSFDLMEPQDAKEAQDKINSGELVLFCAKVTAERSGIELASDYLGGCIYEDATDFYTIYEGEYFADMVQNVLAEAKPNLISLISELSKPC